MSRTFSAAGTLGWSLLVDRAGLMLDEPTVFQHETGAGHSHDTSYTGWMPGGGDEEREGTAIGQTLYNTDGTLAGRLMEGGAGKFYLTTGSGTSQKFTPFRGGTYLLDIGGGEAAQFMVDPAGVATKLGTLTPPAATSHAPPAYSGTQAGQTQAQNAAAALQAQADVADMEQLVASLTAQENEANRNRDFQTAERIAGQKFTAEQNLLAAQNQLKLARLGEAGALARTFEDIKARARDVIAGMMGKNPFRGAVRARGGVPRGVDPYEAFEAELGGVANMPTPQFSSESNLGQLESAIAAMQKTQMPTASWPVGMAGGGKVRPGEVVKVGELGEEYVYNRGGGEVEVIPNRRGARIAGRAQAGGTYDFDKESIAQVLGPAYGHLGLSEAPALYEGPVAGMYGAGWPGAETLSKFGTKPRLVRDPASGRVYWVDPEGTRRHIPDPQSFNEWGFDWKDILNLLEPDMARMYGAPGAQLKSAPSLIEPYQGGYPAQPMPLRLPDELGGYMLPDPRTIANLFRTFDPANREILLDAFELSEMGREQVASSIQAFTPTGTAGRVRFG